MSAAPDCDPRARLASLPTLEDVLDTGRAVVFVGVRPDGARVLAEVPRPLWTQKGYFIDEGQLQPAHLAVFQGTKEAPAGHFSFAVYEDTAQGAEALAKLQGLAL